MFFKGCFKIIFLVLYPWLKIPIKEENLKWKITITRLNTGIYINNIANEVKTIISDYMISIK